MNYAPKMQEILRTNLMTAMDALSEAAGRPRTHFVRAVGGHQSVWARIKNGKRPITTSLYDRMMGGISALWPEDAPWPEGIPRPVPDIDAIRRPEALFRAEAVETVKTESREEAA